MDFGLWLWHELCRHTQKLQSFTMCLVPIIYWLSLLHMHTFMTITIYLQHEDVACREKSSSSLLFRLAILQLALDRWLCTTLICQWWSLWTCSNDFLEICTSVFSISWLKSICMVRIKTYTKNMSHWVIT